MMKEVAKGFIVLFMALALIGTGIDIGESRVSASALSSAHAVAPPPPLQNSLPVCDQFKPVSITTNTQVITMAGSSNFVYFCSINLVAAAADNVALVEGTGATCGTGTAGIAGGATAATGWNLGANNLTMATGSGSGAVAKTAVAGDNVCILVSAASQLSGVISWTAANF
jgi:hypothetical protein